MKLYNVKADIYLANKGCKDKYTTVSFVFICELFN